MWMRKLIGTAMGRYPLSSKCSASLFIHFYQLKVQYIDLHGTAFTACLNINKPP